MKTHIKKAEGVIIVSMDGKLDFGTHVPLRDELHKLVQEAQTDSTPRNIIFNFEKLEFVGSSGISTFVQTLKEFNDQFPCSPRYCNVKSEFRKIIRAFDESEIFQFFDNEDRARKSFDH